MATRILAIVAILASPAAAEILTLTDGDGNVAQIDAGTSQFRWERLRLVMPGRGTHPNDFEQYGELREEGVEVDGDGLFHTTYTTGEYNGHWRDAVPYTLATGWVDIRFGYAIFAPEDVTPPELGITSIEYRIRTTRQVSFPDDPGDGRIAQNIMGDPQEYLTTWRSLPDAFHTMKAAYFTLDTDDGAAWRIGGQQNWNAGAENDIRADMAYATFTVIPEPSSVWLAVAAAIGLLTQRRLRHG